MGAISSISTHTQIMNTTFRLMWSISSEKEILRYLWELCVRRSEKNIIDRENSCTTIVHWPGLAKAINSKDS